MSITAILLSVVSAIIALWAAWTNHKAFSFVKESHERQNRLMHAKSCSELMEEAIVFANSFERELEDIEKLWLKFDSLSTETKNSLNRYSPVFFEYQPQLEGFARQARTLWHEVYEWSEKNLQTGIASRAAHFRRLLADDKQIQDKWRPLLEELRLELCMVNSATKLCGAGQGGIPIDTLNSWVGKF